MNENKKITVIKILIASFILFFASIFIQIITDVNMAFLGSVSMLSILICLIILLAKFIKRFISKNSNTSSYTEQQSSANIPHQTESKNFFQQIKNNIEKNKELKIQKENEKIKLSRELERTQNNYSYGNYEMINGVATIWSGETKPSSFRLYDVKKRFEGIITKLTLNNDDGNFYITLKINDQGEEIVINENDVDTLFLVGSTRYEFNELCRKVFKIELSEMFSFSSFVRNELFKPRLALKINPPQKVMFSHYYGEKVRDLFLVTEYYKNNKDESFLKIKGTQNKSEIVIPTKKITTMIEFQDGKKMKLDEWLKQLTEN